MSAERRRGHGNRHSMPQFPIPLPRGIIGRRIMRQIIRRCRHSDLFFHSPSSQLSKTIIKIVRQFQRRVKRLSSAVSQTSYRIPQACPVDHYVLGLLKRPVGFRVERLSSAVSGTYQLQKLLRMLPLQLRLLNFRFKSSSNIPSSDKDLSCNSDRLGTSAPNN